MYIVHMQGRRGQTGPEASSTEAEARENNPRHPLHHHHCWHSRFLSLLSDAPALTHRFCPLAARVHYSSSSSAFFFRSEHCPGRFVWRLPPPGCWSVRAVSPRHLMLRLVCCLADCQSLHSPLVRPCPPSPRRPCRNADAACSPTQFGSPSRTYHTGRDAARLTTWVVSVTAWAEFLPSFLPFPLPPFHPW